MSRLLGIDSNKTVVRTALIRTAYRKVTLEALGEADVASAGSEVEAVRQAVAALKPDGAAIALSGERSYYRRLDLPAAAQKEIDSVLAFELEATVPFEMDDAVFDYRVLKRRPGETTIPIFAALAQADDVRARIALVREALGIEPERVGTGALPLTNLAAVIPELERPFKAETGGAKPGPVAILDLGDQSSDIAILLDGEPVFARTLSRGTAGLPESAAALARELRQTLAAWRAVGGDPLAGMYLVGGGASAHGAEPYLSTELGVTILPLLPPKLEGMTPEQAAMLPRFAKALGLALGLAGRARGLNLRRGALEAERSYPFLREKVPLLAGLGAVLAVSFGFSLIAELRALDAERAGLEAELAAATREVMGEETTDKDRARELLDSGPGAADEDPMPRVDGFDVMVQLSRAVPRDVVHDVLDFDLARGHVNIQGVVPTKRDADDIAEKMKEHRCFKDVKVPNTTPYGSAESGKQKYTLSFDIKCDKEKKPGAAGAGSAAPAVGSARPGAAEGGK
ncbi:MAG: pilus assembly protein PilM [Polyangiaceae bacterium]